jgi:hypothetical protein
MRGSFDTLAQDFKQEKTVCARPLHGDSFIPFVEMRTEGGWPNSRTRKSEGARAARLAGPPLTVEWLNHAHLRLPHPS